VLLGWGKEEGGDIYFRDLGNIALQTMPGFGMAEPSQPWHVKEGILMDIGTAKEGGWVWASPNPTLPSFGLQRIIT